MITGTLVAILSLAGVIMLGIPTELVSGFISLIVFIIVSLSTQKDDLAKNN